MIHRGRQLGDEVRTWLAEEKEKEKLYDHYRYVYGEASPRKSPQITAVANTGQLMVSYETIARKG